MRAKGRRRDKANKIRREERKGKSKGGCGK